MGDLLQWSVYAAQRFNRCREAALGEGGHDPATRLGR